MNKKLLSIVLAVTVIISSSAQAEVEKNSLGGHMVWSGLSFFGASMLMGNYKITKSINLKPVFVKNGRLPIYIRFLALYPFYKGCEHFVAAVGLLSEK